MNEQRHIPIQIDVVYSTQGEVTPRWLRFENEEHRIERVSINRVLSRKSINYVGIDILQVICTATISDRERVFELRRCSDKWTLFQMIS